MKKLIKYTLPFCIVLITILGCTENKEYVLMPTSKNTGEIVGIWTVTDIQILQQSKFKSNLCWYSNFNDVIKNVKFTGKIYFTEDNKVYCYGMILDTANLMKIGCYTGEGGDQSYDYVYDPSFDGTYSYSNKELIMKFNLSNDLVRKNIYRKWVYQVQQTVIAYCMFHKNGDNEADLDLMMSFGEVWRISLKK